MQAAIQNKQRVMSLITEHQTRLRALGVARLGLFGSFARNEQNADSDIDLIVEFDAGRKTFDNFMQLGFFLEDLFHRRVELITPESMSPYIRPHIVGEVEYVAVSG